ncbi:MAG: hypothetical protein HYT79_01785 [Elusimicrobia bacterium]|nr:hypothetical protein [Elusimicrobiota bacterium]
MTAAGRVWFFLLVFAPVFSWGIPPFESLYESKYGYRVNCTLCHLQNDWSLNHYGDAILALGASSDTMKNLEKIDVDKDGFATNREIEAKSNPGDASSTPEDPGLWLLEIVPIKPPLKSMALVFPQAVAFSTFEKKLSAIQMNQLEKIAGAKNIEDIDHYGVVFLAKGRDGVVGGSCYVSLRETSSKGAEMHIFFLSADPNGRIRDVDVVHSDRKILNAPDFLKRFRGLYPGEVLTMQLPKSINKKLAESIRIEFAKRAAHVDLLIGP